MFQKIAFLALLAIGLFLFAFGLYFPFDAWAAKDWTPIEGEVVKVWVTSERGVGPRQTTVGKGPFAPNIRYRWTVDGTAYDGKLYRLGHGSNADASWRDYPTREEAREAVAEYRRGSPITVYYDPANPSRAVLDPRPSPVVWVPLALSPLFLGLVFVLYRYREPLHAAANRPANQPMGPQL